MASRRYLNFDLLLDEEGEGNYQALVTGSPLGETPSVRFNLPFDATTLENLLLKLDPGRSGTRRTGGTSRQQAAMDFGGPLFEAVFRDGLLLAWTRSHDVAREQDSGLRLRLRMGDAPALAGLPWELLYDARSNCFLAQSERTPLVRFLDVPNVARPISVDGPLRVLAIISAPTDVEELDVEAEWARIHEALAPRIAEGLVVVDRLPQATVRDLGIWLRQHQTHVIHFVGHGDFDKSLGEGVLYFEDRHGRSAAVTSSVLGPFLRDHDPLRMVVLNACRSARTDAVDPFGGMAQGLVQQDATAVVAMQFPISDRAAVSFTGAFYGALVDGLPVDQATSSARKALLADHGDEWATPVLFLRSPDGDIFADVRPADDFAPDTPAPPDHVPEEALPSPPALPEEELAPPQPVADPDVPGTPRPPERADGTAAPRGRPLVLGGAALVASLVVAGVAVVALNQSGNDTVPVNPDTTPDTTPAASSATSDAGPKSLPVSEGLSSSQFAVAAGDNRDSLDIWIVDTADPASATRVTSDPPREWLPTLSPDRRTVIFTHVPPKPSTDITLVVAGAADGKGARPFFDQTPPQCAAKAVRPAWFRDVEQLAMPCLDAGGGWHLLIVDLNGQVQRVLDPTADVGTVGTFGDPTVSPDGSTIVVWGSPDPRALAGSLYTIDVASGSWTQALPSERRRYSDPAFSPDGGSVAYRDDVTGHGEFQIAVASVDQGTLVDPRYVVETPGIDQDPMYSPDGQQIVYGHIEPGSSLQQLRVVDATGGTPQPLVFDGLPAYQAVPSWSRR